MNTFLGEICPKKKRQSFSSQIHLKLRTMSKAEESIDGIEKFNEKIYEDGITWLFGHHCLEYRHLTFAQHEVKELAKYFYELGYHQAEKDLELTYDDICEIMEIREDVLDMDSYENLYEEVLKRFKKMKGKENKL